MYQVLSVPVCIEPIRVRFLNSSRQSHPSHVCRVTRLKTPTTRIDTPEPFGEFKRLGTRGVEILPLLCLGCPKTHVSCLMTSSSRTVHLTRATYH